ncbi:MAG TPA: sodium:proton antiporter [Verrucomicrobiae bacterium]|nr:sodium:proton antiporter [Verrucomicrobiae bacterium]
MVLPNAWMVLPFVLLLLSMAAAPVLVPDWWRRHYPLIALGLGAITVAYYLVGMRASVEILHLAREYVSFIVLIGSLFVVSGGIHLRFSGNATPLANTVFLLAGALAANVLGSTGAAMLLIRPWIHANKQGFRAHHIAFFIFIIANVGGCLTPIGNAPLFLGYLQGVPFWWVTEHCWPAWVVGTGLLLGIFYSVDKFHHSRAPKADGEAESERWKFSGLFNVFFIAVIIGAVFIEKPVFLREAVMVVAALGSYLITRRHFRQVHEKNEFDFRPLNEVAVLFAGIFATMMPALDLLQAHARDLLGANPQAGVFYWSTGGLSAVLDNAPTYLGFFTALQGIGGAENVSGLLARNGSDVLAVSLGAVFFGAATYIGNNPNFMIKAIAERQKVSAPGFLEFIWKFTLPLLLPVLAVVWLIFFH